MLDLHQVGRAKDASGTPIVERLIAEGKASLFDVPIDELARKDGSIGKLAERQRIQITSTLKDETWIEPLPRHHTQTGLKSVDVISDCAQVTCNHPRTAHPMPSPKRPRSSRDKVRAHRERLRNEGLRPIQIWVPDVRSPAFRAAAHRQSRAVAMSRFAKRDQSFVEAITLALGDEEG